MERDKGKLACRRRPDEPMERPKAGAGGPVEWIRTLPADALEPHPLVQELRRALHSREAALARTEREVARLRVAVAFGLPNVPGRSDGLSGGPK